MAPKKNGAAAGPSIWDLLRSRDSQGLSRAIAAGVDVNQSGAVSPCAASNLAPGLPARATALCPF